MAKLKKKEKKVKEVVEDVDEPMDEESEVLDNASKPKKVKMSGDPMIEVE